jgi:uncharacterized protein YndB with AHSA1/START domain
MALNTIQVDVPAEAVFEVLADPRLYANWVVGASTTRAVDGRWPDQGSVLHHTQMLVLQDTTTVLKSQPPTRLVLEVRARPIAVARVDITLEPHGDGTRIVLDERMTGGLAGGLPRSVSDALIRIRNGEAVRRLKSLAEIGRRVGQS